MDDKSSNGQETADNHVHLDPEGNLEIIPVTAALPESSAAHIPHSPIAYYAAVESYARLRRVFYER